MTMRVKSLKCKTCGIVCEPEFEKVELTVSTCWNRHAEGEAACGIKRIRDTLFGIKAELAKRGVRREVLVNYRKIDPNLQAAYPHKHCEFCGINVADASVCRAKDIMCPLVSDPFPKKQLPALLAPRAACMENTVDVVSSIDASKGEFEFVVPDPINIFIDKKGRHNFSEIL